MCLWAPPTLHRPSTCSAIVPRFTFKMTLLMLCYFLLFAAVGTSTHTSSLDGRTEQSEVLLGCVSLPLWNRRESRHPGRIALSSDSVDTVDTDTSTVLALMVQKKSSFHFQESILHPWPKIWTRGDRGYAVHDHIAGGLILNGCVSPSEVEFTVLCFLFLAYLCFIGLVLL